MVFSGWSKSLHCKSNALEDVYLPSPTITTSSKRSGTLAVSCSSSSQTLRDVVFLFPNKLPPLPRKSQNSHSNLPQIQRQNTKPNPKSKPKSNPNTSSVASPPPSPVSLPTLVDLPREHSSRRVVEIIFGSSWSPRGSPFSGEIEMLFRVHHPPRSVARFEDHRSAVRSRSDDPRCAADGNEMMRFHPSVAASAAAGAIYNAGVSVCTVGKMKGVRTFAGSGGAHETAGGEPGRRAMLVCRVIAGRVTDGSNSNSVADSVCLGKGELLVFDPKAVLPCFLIIYKISP